MKIQALTMQTPFPVGDVNGYLILEEPLSIIDTGLKYCSNLDIIQNGLSRNGYTIKDLKRHGYTALTALILVITLFALPARISIADNNNNPAFTLMGSLDITGYGMISVYGYSYVVTDSGKVTNLRAFMQNLNDSWVDDIINDPNIDIIFYDNGQVNTPGISPDTPGISPDNVPIIQTPGISPDTPGISPDAISVIGMMLIYIPDTASTINDIEALGFILEDLGTAIRVTITTNVPSNNIQDNIISNGKGIQVMRNSGNNNNDPDYHLRGFKVIDKNRFIELKIYLDDETRIIRINKVMLPRTNRGKFQII